MVGAKSDTFDRILLLEFLFGPIEEIRLPYTGLPSNVDKRVVTVQLMN